MHLGASLLQLWILKLYLAPLNASNLTLVPTMLLPEPWQGERHVWVCCLALLLCM